MRSRPCMASDINSTISEDEADLALSWSGRWTLGHRILAVNVLTLAACSRSASSISTPIRNRLSKERTRQTRIEATTTAQALAHVARSDWPALLAAVSKASGSRMRVYGPDGSLRPTAGEPPAPLTSCATPIRKNGRRTSPARSIAASTCWSAPGSSMISPSPRSTGCRRGRRRCGRRRAATPVSEVRNAPDLTPVISAAAPVGDNVLLVTDNDRAFTRTVRNQRRTLATIMAAVILLILSRFPRPDHRPAAAPPRARCASRAAWAIARGQRPAAAVTDR